MVDLAVTIPYAWSMSDNDNSVYIEPVNYTLLKTQFKQDIHRIQMQARLMGETESERPERAARIANEAATTIQAIWDFQDHMRVLTYLQTEHGILVPNTELRGRLQNTY